MGWEEGHETWNLNSMTEFSLDFMSVDGTDIAQLIKSIVCSQGASVHIPTPPFTV